MIRKNIWMITLAMGLAVFALGCKPKKVQTVEPTPVPTPVPVLGNVVFVQGGHLVELNLANNQVTPLTSGKSTEWFPVASPKGDQVVYWSNADTNIYNLWKMDLASGQRTQLTFNEENGLQTNEQNLLINDGAAWSTDGRSILYTQDGDIWQIDADGFNPKTILAGHDALCPSYSPDGKNVIFLAKSKENVYNIFQINLNDRSVKQVTQYIDWNVGSASYSTDGSKILFNLYRQDVTQIYTVKADGTDPLNVTTNVRCLCPRFGQGDKKIYYAAYGVGEDTTLNIYAVSANGLDVKALTTNGGASPTWGAQLAPVATTAPAVATAPKK